MTAHRPGLLQSRAARRVGQTVGGKYVLGDVLGVGGMSTVYAGTHRNGLAVAIKVLHDDLARDERVRRWFLREGYLANRVDHRGAVRVLDDDVTEDGAAYLVIERLYGDTLREIGKRVGPTMPPREVLLFAYDVLDVVAAAHARGIVHRDLKPENLFLTDEGEVKVLDFGIAHPLPVPGESAAAATLRLVGTPAFMAPEQVRGVDVRAETDVWGVGATMFSLITGEYVHANAPPTELFAWAANRPARPVGSLAPGLPSAVASVIDRALAFEPEQRFATAQGMREALAAAFAGSFGASLEESRAAILGELRARDPVVPRTSPAGDAPPAVAPPAPRSHTDVRAVLTRTATERLETQGPGRFRRVSLVLAGVALLAVMVTAAVRFGAGRARGGTETSSSEVGSRVEGTAVPTPARVAVLGFTSAVKDATLEADGARAAEHVAAALELDGPMVLHAGDSGRGDIAGKLAAARAGKDAAALGATGVQYALVGSVGGDVSRVDARVELVDMKGGATVASIDAHGPEARFAEIMDRLSDSARALLSMAALDADSRRAVRRVLPEDPEAAREYVRALTLLDRGELRAARGKLVALGAGAKSHARTQVLVAEINRQLGDEAEAKTYADRARGLVEELPERERLPIEARGELASGNAQVAVAKLKALTHRSVEDTVRLAEAAEDATRYEDGLAALGELEVFGDAFARDAHILQLRASLAWNKSDLDGALRYAREAAAVAGERVAVRAQAKRFKAKALYLQTGATPEANAAFEEAMSLLLAIDDTRHVAALYIASGDAKYDAMDFTGAIEEYRAALEMKGVPASSTGDTLLERITDAEWKLGHYAEAERMFDGLVSKKDLNDFARGYAYLYAAAGARDQGHVREAWKRLAKAKEALGDKMPSDRVLTLVEESALERTEGRTELALTRAREAFQLASTEVKEFRTMAANAMGWAYLASHQGNEARKMFVVAHEYARQQHSRIDEDEACKGLAKTGAKEASRLCEHQ